MRKVSADPEGKGVGQLRREVLAGMRESIRLLVMNESRRRTLNRKENMSHSDPFPI